MNKVIRFRVKPYRFRVTKDNVSVYRRDDDHDTDRLVRPQLAGRMKNKYADKINEARMKLS